MTAGVNYRRPEGDLLAMRHRLLPVLTAALLAPAASAQIVPPDGGITFEQISFGFYGLEQQNSSTARAVADVPLLYETTGVRRGFVNIHTEEGWVVQNWPLDLSEAALRDEQPAIPPDTYYFRLFTPTISQPTRQVLTLDAVVRFTSAPQINIQIPDQFTRHPVRFHIWDAEGCADRPVSTAPAPPPVIEVSQLPPPGPTYSHILPNPINVEAADDQCFPMSMANSLQYLEARYGLDVPNDHNQGQRGDQTLVGRLDELAGRSVTNRRNGSGTWFEPMMDGKFEYLEETRLTTALVMRHQGRGWGGAGERMPDGDFTRHGATSVDDGANVTWKWICDQIKLGEDVELVFSYDDASGQPTGGHAVRVFGCGMTNGRPWLKYLHDSAQFTDSFGLETPTVYPRDIDGDGMLNMGAANQEIRFAASESATDAVKNGTFAPPQTTGEAILSAVLDLDRKITGGALTTVFGVFKGLLSSEVKEGEPFARAQASNLEVLVNGISAPVFFSNDGQINFQMPVEVEPGIVSLLVRIDGQPSDLVTTEIVESSPGLFMLPASVAGAGRGVVQNQDFSLNLPDNPAAPGQVIILYATGTGPYSPQPGTGELAGADPLSLVELPVTATVGGVAADVLFAGATPGFAGLTQFNLLVPQAPAGDQPVVVNVGGVDSNSVLAAIGP